jgi:hypothetical protein
MRKLAPKSYEFKINEEDQNDLTTMVCNLHYFPIAITITDSYVQLSMGIVLFTWDRKTEKLLERRKV